MRFIYCKPLNASLHRIWSKLSESVEAIKEGFQLFYNPLLAFNPAIRAGVNKNVRLQDYDLQLASKVNTNTISRAWNLDG